MSAHWTFDEMDDLFDDDSDDDALAEDALEAFSTGLWQLRRIPGEDSEVIGIDDLKVTFSTDDYNSKLNVQTSLFNKLEKSKVEMDTLRLLLRDAEGRLLDYSDESLGAKFTRAQEVVDEFEFGLGLADAVHTIDVYAEYQFTFQSVLAVAQIPATRVVKGPNSRDPLVFDLKRAPLTPGLPSFDLSINGFAGNRWDDCYAEFVVELAELTPTLNNTRTVIAALRDANGQIAVKREEWLSVPGVQTPTHLKFNLEVKRRILQEGARLDVAVKGETRRYERLGRYQRSTWV